MRSDHETTGAVSADEFCKALWDDISIAFAENFGPKWTPQVEALYKATMAGVIELCRVADGHRFQPPEPPTQIRILSNYGDRGRS